MVVLTEAGDVEATARIGAAGNRAENAGRGDPAGEGTALFQ